jgi:molybdate transport system substrate-binding protein
MCRPFKTFVIAALTLSLQVTAAFAAEIKLMCPPPMRTTIVELVAQFERVSPHKATIMHTPSRMIVERIQGGEAFDVSILTAEATDALIKQGKVARRIDIARSSIGLGVRTGSPTPDVSSAEAVKRTLLATKSFARNEGAESGKHMLAVFDRLGIAEAMKAKTKAMPLNTGYVAELVVRGEADLVAATDARAEGGCRHRGRAAAAGASARHCVFGRCLSGAGDARCGQCVGSIPVVARSRFGAAVEGSRPAVILNPAGTPRRRTTRS